MRKLDQPATVQCKARFSHGGRTRHEVRSHDRESAHVDTERIGPGYRIVSVAAPTSTVSQKETSTGTDDDAVVPLPS
jgi:hypothetical protein